MEGKFFIQDVGRYTDMRCPDAMYFDINSTEAEQKIGAESVEINGAGY